MGEFIYDFSMDELKERVTPSFRAKQIYDWLYAKYVTSFEDMKNIPKDMQAKLGEEFSMGALALEYISLSKDGSKKYLFRTSDGHSFEAVMLLMREEERDEEGKIVEGSRHTLCLSTQIGCKIGCAFCLTAKGGFVRNLSAGEIVYQVVAIKKDLALPPAKSLNIVYMGMGEPLDNFDNLTKAIKIIADEQGLNISVKRQTVSTSGLSTKIERLGIENLGVNLAISLHAVDDELRDKLMPINKAYNIKSVIEAIKKFPIDRRKRVMFEYLMLGGLNDSVDAAKKLLKLIEGIKAKVNLIYFNPYEGSEFKRPSRESMEAFQKFLHDRGVVCTIRESRGLDIEAACGQLREKRG